MCALLENVSVLLHPFVIGELACGNLENRAELLETLGRMPATDVADSHEVLYFVEKNQLMGRGIGYIDVHLLAAAALGRTTLWTLDRKLRDSAVYLGLAFQPQ